MRPGCQGRKRNPNPNFLVRISSGGVGVFRANGWGPKSSVCRSKPRETKLLGGLSRDFCRDIPELPEKFEKKKLCSIFGPRLGQQTHMKVNMGSSRGIVWAARKDEAKEHVSESLLSVVLLWRPLWWGFAVLLQHVELRRGKVP